VADLSEGPGVNVDGYFISNHAPVNVLVCPDNVAAIKTNTANNMVFFMSVIEDHR